MPRKAFDYTGQRFNKLVAVKRVEYKKGNWWLFKCDCGNEKVINIENVKRGDTKACGCLKGGKSKYKNVNHPIYKRWWHMINRCENKKDISYKNYGAIGIKVCEEWHDFDNFYEWAVSNGFDTNLELDRIDVNGNYEANNCRFIPRTVNARNKRDSLIYEYQGVKKPLAQIAEENGISYKVLWQRLHREKMTLDEAVNYKLKKRLMAENGIEIVEV